MDSLFIAKRRAGGTPRLGPIVGPPGARFSSPYFGTPPEIASAGVDESALGLQPDGTFKLVVDSLTPGVGGSEVLTLPSQPGDFRLYRPVAITDDMTLAFFGVGSHPDLGLGYYPPASWSSPGRLWRRPRTAFVASAHFSANIIPREAGVITSTFRVPSLYLDSISGGYVTAPWQQIYASRMNREDVPGPLPPDFTLASYYNGTGALIDDVLPHPAANRSDLGLDISRVPNRVVTSDFLFVHVGTVQTHSKRVNVRDVIDNLRWFPRYAVRFYLANPDDVQLPVFPTGPFAQQLYDSAMLTRAALQANAAAVRDAMTQACADLVAAGVDAKIAGDEGDATKANIGRLIADHFGFGG